jgi:hypothetical protein
MTENSIEVKLEENAKQLSVRANAMIATNQEEAKQCVDFISMCASVTKKIKSYWDGTKDNPGPLALAKKTYDSLRLKKNTMLSIPEESRQIVEKKLRVYREEQRKIEAEKQRKADEARLKEEERLMAKELKKAEKALDKGNEKKAEEFIDKAEEIHVAPVDVEKTVNKTEKTDDGAVTGIMDIKTYVGDIKDIAAGVASGALPEHLIDLKTGAAKTWAKGNGYKSGVYHGIVVEEYERFSARQKEVNYD